MHLKNEGMEKGSRCRPPQQTLLCPNFKYPYPKGQWHHCTCLIHRGYRRQSRLPADQWECCCCSLRIFVINNTRVVCSTKEYTVSANKAQKDVIKPNWYDCENVVEGKDNYCQRNSLLFSSYRNSTSTHLLKRLPQDAGMWLHLNHFIIIIWLGIM